MPLVCSVRFLISFKTRSPVFDLIVTRELLFFRREDRAADGNPSAEKAAQEQMVCWGIDL
ncbi:MAG TPA: hypothetical protein DE060_14870 [Lentisphaeria bacterium]|nr:hypothetical protein [Lentisphaeria bacterium]HCG50474.1 hypothetical protein [Lentisphaeria bacterium]